MRDLADRLARMRRPEVRLNPADVGRLHDALAPAEPATLIPLASVPVIADATVPVGEARVVDRAAVDMEVLLRPLVPSVVEPSALAEIDRTRELFRAITPPKPIEWRCLVGCDLGYSPDVTVIAAMEDGRFVSVRYIRRPWRLTGRARTRALWRRRGRR